MTARVRKTRYLHSPDVAAGATCANAAHAEPAGSGGCRHGGESHDHACGCVITAVLVVAMLFEDWLASRLAPAPGRALTLGLTAVVAIVLNRSLAAYADTVPWVKASPDDWVTTAVPSFIGTGIILHVGIGLRWPLALKPGDD